MIGLIRLRARLRLKVAAMISGRNDRRNRFLPRAARLDSELLMSRRGAALQAAAPCPVTSGRLETGQAE
jgi:hypothetical protein